MQVLGSLEARHEHGGACVGIARAGAGGPRRPVGDLAPEPQPVVHGLGVARRILGPCAHELRARLGPDLLLEHAPVRPPRRRLRGRAALARRIQALQEQREGRGRIGRGDVRRGRGHGLVARRGFGLGVGHASAVLRPVVVFVVLVQLRMFGRGREAGPVVVRRILVTRVRDVGGVVAPVEGARAELRAGIYPAAALVSALVLEGDFDRAVAVFRRQESARDSHLAVVRVLRISDRQGARELLQRVCEGVGAGGRGAKRREVRVEVGGVGGEKGQALEKGAREEVVRERRRRWEEMGEDAVADVEREWRGSCERGHDIWMERERRRDEMHPMRGRRGEEERCVQRSNASGLPVLVAMMEEERRKARGLVRLGGGAPWGRASE
ncbi:unnamed protein product [Cutaneotrichosporon oleaginosum]